MRKQHVGVCRLRRRWTTEKHRHAKSIQQDMVQLVHMRSVRYHEVRLFSSFAVFHHILARLKVVILGVCFLLQTFQFLVKTTAGYDDGRNAYAKFARAEILMQWEHPRVEHPDSFKLGLREPGGCQ